MMTTMTCRECARTFDMTDEDDAGKWAYGHDCEPGKEEFFEPTLVIDPRNDPHMHRNMNGSWNCDRCQMLVILFDDDQHDCTGRPWWLD